jgi:hypothetical protein
MPLGNGAPRGLPSTPLGVLTDPRQYNTANTPAGTFQPVFSGGRNPLAASKLSPYAQAVLATPGLSYWWRFDNTYNGNGGGAPGGFSRVFPNYAGPTTLGISGTVNQVPGLIPGDTNGAAQLVASGSGNLKEGDYWIPNVQGQECFSQEFWLNVTSGGITTGNFSCGGAWDGTHGWMVNIAAGGNVRLFIGTTNWDSGYTLSANRTYHIVMVYGGPADYRSHLYVNGKEVASTAAWGLLGLFASTFNFEVGKYNNSSVGANFMDGIIDELALYTRMLQPAEVLQHYQAAFARA